MRPTQQNPQGGIMTIEAPDPCLQRDGRLPRVRSGDSHREALHRRGAKKVRVCKKCGKDIVVKDEK